MIDAMFVKRVRRALDLQTKKHMNPAGAPSGMQVTEFFAHNFASNVLCYDTYVAQNKKYFPNASASMQKAIWLN